LVAFGLVEGVMDAFFVIQRDRRFATHQPSVGHDRVLVQHCRFAAERLA